jgi:Family of unknown function (DUF6328)
MNEELGETSASDEGEDSTKERRDRELMELLNELRVALPGVQVLFAFLLTVPFAQGFKDITTSQRNVYFAAVLCAATATAMLIAPSAYHRIQFREGDKERMLKISNALALGGLFFLAAAIVCSMYVITDVVIGGAWTPAVAAFFAGLFTLLWFVLPLYRKSKT